MAHPHDSASAKAEALRLGFTTVGVCDAVEAPHAEFYNRWIDKGYHGTMEYLASHRGPKKSPQSLLPGARSLILVTLNYNQPNPPQAGKPRIARYALGRDYHRVLHGKLKRLKGWIEQTYPGETCRATVDSAPLFERDYARLAGLGWFGKNTMLIDSRRGSWFFIGALLTTVHLQPDAPAEGGCGNCTRCIDACPTGAIVFEDGRWQIDARRCVSYLTIEHKGLIDPALQNKLGGWTFGCDVCQEVCPFNAPRESQPLRAAQTGEPDFTPREWPSLRELVKISEADWDRLTQGSPIRRTGREGLQRNAKLGLNE